MDTDGNRLLDK